MTPTLKDIASHTGLSIATVSRVLNKRPVSIRVSRATQRRVLEVARQLGYHPHRAARALVSKKTRTIGFVIYDLSYLSAAVVPTGDLLEGVFSAAEHLGHNVIVCTTAEEGPFDFAQDRPLGSAQDRPDTHHFLRAARERLVDGFVVWDWFVPEALLLEAVANGVPIVTVHRTLTDPTIPAIDCDMFQAGWLAADHLLSRGHRRIAFFGGLSQGEVSKGWEMVDGIRAAHAEHRVPFPEEFVKDSSAMPKELTEEERVNIRLDQVLADDDPPTAVLCGSDHTGVFTIGQLHRRGRRVPEEIAVTGCDGMAVGEMVVPRLTTVSVPYREMASEAVRALLALMEGNEPGSQRRLFEPRLIPRESS